MGWLLEPSVKNEVIEGITLALKGVVVVEGSYDLLDAAPVLPLKKKKQKLL
jgi:hypothetical protein